MTSFALGPWFILVGYAAITWWAVPRRVSPAQFFEGQSPRGDRPGIFLVAFSAAISWVFAKSIANAAGLAATYGLIGGIGYTIYYASFLVAGLAIFLIRTKGGYRSLSHFLGDKYGVLCARLFMGVIAFRLLNEVWSNTKVMALYFGSEGSGGYWAAVVLITAFTVSYAWSGGMRASLLTDRLQTLIALVLLGLVVALLFPALRQHDLTTVPAGTQAAGLTFCALAAVQIFSYPFHDPVLTDRAFLNSPRRMLISFVLAGLLSGGFIFLFSFVGLYARAQGLDGEPFVAVPASFGFIMLLVFNGIMLLSGGSTLDSTFTSTAKLSARDWNSGGMMTSPAGQLRTGRIALIVIALLGNLPLLSIYLGPRVGPAIIAATTISGTMVMGLAPVFLLAWMRRAGALSFHLAFWPGVLIGIVRAVETFAKISLIPPALGLGSGDYALDLGVNIYGVLLCTAGYVAGALLPFGCARARMERQ